MVATNAPAQIAPGTGAAQQPTVSFSQVNAQCAAAFGNVGTPATNATSGTFPAARLGIRVDLNLGGTWTDITQFVYQRNPVQISNMGRPDWTSTIQPAQLTLTLNDRDGRFSPKNTAGAFFPNITRNCPIRVFVSATSSTGQSYAGFRFYGEVTEWPPRWDPSGHDVAVDIVASGIWRRISQQQTTLGSAYRRYVDNLTGPAVQAYWPMEDGSGSGQLVPFGSPAGTQNALQQFVGGEAGLSLASADAFPGSDALPQLNGATIIATVPAGGTPTNNVVRFGISVPAAGDSGSASTNWNLVEIDTAGTMKRFELFLLPSGLLLFQGVNNAGAVVFSGTTTTNVKGQPYLVSMELTAGVNFALRLIKAGGSGITESVTGSLGSGSVGAISRIQISRAFALQDTGFGQMSVFYGSPPSMVAAATALNGYVGEKALDRFVRICAEQGIATETIGTSSQSAALGPQVDDTIANILQAIEDTDCGLLYETKDQFGLGYRTNGSMANQVVAATLNYTAAVIDASLAPAYDDSLSRNNITITNWTGYTQQAILTTGAMSILNPPSGIGNGYSYTRNVIAAVDTQVPGIATFLLNLGASDEIRFPVVSVKMIRSQSANLFTIIPNLDIGDYFQITNPPSFLTATVIKQLVWGYAETLNAKEWTFAFNSVPETPWETGVSPGTIQTAQIPGGSPVSSQASGQLGLAALIANGSITPAMLSNGITIHTFGGNAVTISIGQPGNPNVNDIWINATTGLISSWNGTIWAPTTFNATNTIQAGTIISSLIAAGTIVATNIAASTITAANLIAGIVVAGIVDATNVFANTYVATSAGGEFLAYDVSTPTTGHLVNSIAGSSGTDSVSNTFPKGLLSQQLTLPNQGSAPPSFSGASVFYSSSLGRPRYLSAAGDDSAIERSIVSQTNVTMTTNTIATAISADMTVQSSEANVGSEFEIEISGLITAPTAGSGFSSGASGIAYTMQMMINGSVIGGAFTLGGVYLTQGGTFNFNASWRLSIEATGAGGTATVTSWGAFLQQGINIGNLNAGGVSVAQGAASTGTGKAFDTTTSNTLKIFGFWGSTLLTGHHVATFRSKFGRRM